MLYGGLCWFLLFHNPKENEYRNYLYFCNCICLYIFISLYLSITLPLIKFVYLLENYFIIETWISRGSFVPPFLAFSHKFQNWRQVLFTNVKILKFPYIHIYIFHWFQIHKIIVTIYSQLYTVSHVFNFELIISMYINI